MNKIKTFFKIEGAYRLDITDITALIYTICAVGIILGFDMTVLFFIGSLIATAFSWQAHKVNLIVLNLSMLALNTYNLIQMWG
jgi:hypothetical protein